MTIDPSVLLFSPSGAPGPSTEAATSGGIDAAFAELKRALHEEGRLQVERQLEALEQRIARQLGELHDQAVAVADANANAVLILAQQKDIAEQLARQNDALAEQNRAIASQREDLETQLAALANANVDAVLQVAESENKLFTLSQQQAELTDANRDISAQARQLELEAMALAESNVDAVQMLAEKESELSGLATKTQAMEQANVELEEKAFIDELTGLFNHRYFKEQLSHEVARSRRYGRDLSVLFVDVDHFKKVNDTHGHQVGDEVLQTIGRLLEGEVRGADVAVRLGAEPFAFRYGGEEFVLLLPETGAEGALTAAERLRSKIENHPFPCGHTQPLGKITISLGIAALQASEPDGLSMVRRADEALYRAKRGGRNRAELAD